MQTIILEIPQNISDECIDNIINLSNNVFSEQELIVKKEISIYKKMLVIEAPEQISIQDMAQISFMFGLNLAITHASQLLIQQPVNVKI